jgi:hypothetical protein
VDAVLAYEDLPLFSYWSTFPESRLLHDEELSDVFWPVQVTGETYAACKASALSEVTALGQPAPDFMRDVVDELAAYDYEWQPEMPIHEGSPDDPKVRFLAFALGGALFDAFAERISGDDDLGDQAQRILQPKRARLFAELALGRAASSADPEREVFEEIARQVQDLAPGITRVTRIPRTRTFCRYS